MNRDYLQEELLRLTESVTRESDTQQRERFASYISATVILVLAIGNVAFVSIGQFAEKGALIACIVFLLPVWTIYTSSFVSQPVRGASAPGFLAVVAMLGTWGKPIDGWGIVALPVSVVTSAVLLAVAAFFRFYRHGEFSYVISELSSPNILKAGDVSRMCCVFGVVFATALLTLSCIWWTSVSHVADLIGFCITFLIAFISFWLVYALRRKERTLGSLYSQEAKRLYEDWMRKHR